MHYLPYVVLCKVKSSYGLNGDIEIKKHVSFFLLSWHAVRNPTKNNLETPGYLKDNVDETFCTYVMKVIKASI